MTNIKDIAKEITKVAGEYDKPVYTSFMGESDVAKGIVILQRNEIPHYILPESMSKSFAVVNNFHNRLNVDRTYTRDNIEGANSDLVYKIIDESLEGNNTFLTEDKALKVLEAYGINTPEHYLAGSPQEAVDAFNNLKSDVVMKIVSPDVIHKSDSGGVLVGLKTEAEVKEGYQTIIDNVKGNNPQAKIEGILITKMIKGALETVVGLKRDIAFGCLVLVEYLWKY